MARAISVWLSSLTLCALSACGGSEAGFFSDVVPAGAGGSGSGAGSSSHAGSSSTSSSGNPGIGGNSSSGGGANSSGGSPASAGTANSSGTSSGGAQTGGTSSGGRAGAHSGGSGGSRAGAGGSSASAGHAGALVGSAGTGGASQELTCSELLKLANDQLADARACNAAASTAQCTGTVDNPCGCEVPVQKAASTETKAYLATLKQLKDKDCVEACPKAACALVNNAECQQSGSGSSTTGTCVISHSGPLP